MIRFLPPTLVLWLVLAGGLTNSTAHGQDLATNASAAADATASEESTAPVVDAPTNNAATSNPAAPITPPSTASGETGLQFNFSGAAWGDVLQWFAEQADLSLQMDATPSGTVNFSDRSKRYTVAEGLDLLNRLLLDRGWAIVRRGRLLLLVDLEATNADKLISEMAELVTPDQFDERGNSDIVRAVFPLGGLEPERAREELGQIIGPWGRVSVLAGARQVIVTETVGKLKTINRVLEASIKAETDVMNVDLAYRAADEVLEIARPLLGLEPGQNSGEDIRIAVPMFGDRIFATGDPGQLALLQRVIEQADTPLPGTQDSSEAELVSAVLKTHVIEVADLQTTYDVLQTLVAGTPDTRLAVDANRNAIIASARPETHAIIEQTIAELEGDGKGFTIIDLKRLEPAQALLTINKFFGVTGDGSGNGPIVDGDPESRRLWVRGTPQQVELVRQLIDELENDSLAGGLGDNVRILPLTESSARDTIDQLESLWPLMGRGTRLRIIGPSDGNNSNDSLRQQRDENNRGTQPNAPLNQPFRSPPVNDSVDVRAERLVQPQTLVWQLPEGAAEPMSSSSEVVPEIVIQVTPAGLIIASQDTAALDSLEQIITSLSDASLINSDVPTIFRLQYLKADVAAEMVAGVLGGADAGASASSLTDSVVSGLGGGMLGGLLGVGGGGDDDSGATSVLTSRGNVNIVPDNRLNSLIVQASPTDLEFIRVILKEIDQEESPIVVRTVAQPKLIPVIYQDAADVAKIVKEVFADKVQSDESNSRGGRGGGGGAPSPQDFFAALRGGRGGGGGGNTEKPKSEPVPLIVAVDERSNSLIVTSTPQDIQMVEELVAALDQSGLENEETVEVIPITGTMNPEVLRQALESVLGQTASSTGENSGGNSGASNGSGGSSSGSESSPSPDEIRRRIEAFRSRFGGGGGGSPFGGGGFGGGRGGPPGAASGGARGATGGRGGPTGGGRPGGGRGGR